MYLGVTTLEQRVTKAALLLTSFVIINDEDKFLTPIDHKIAVRTLTDAT